jgi:poly-gamma-glutamate synthesis protein (capsule biosynthesis protein)
MAAVTLFLSGDVMTGRGIDQILPYPSDPALFEDYVRTASEYVALAERAHGAIGAPVDFGYVWGDALDELEQRRPDARIINLETAVTASKVHEPKGINYKMNPANIPVLTAAGIDCCVLSNNHVLDWGEAGLLDTLASLKDAGIQSAGAGSSLAEASSPALIELSGDCRICVYGLGAMTSGIPSHWAAAPDRPGIHLLPDLSERTAQRIGEEVKSRKRPGDIIVMSIHWGSNWGYKIVSEQRSFAHALIDLGACDVLHGHSSHHARPIEVYRGKPILYGCGDFINDYEGIAGLEQYRGDLSLMYLPRINTANAALESLTIIVFQKHRFRLRRASRGDLEWLKTKLNEESRSFGTRLSLDRDGRLEAHWT